MKNTRVPKLLRIGTLALVVLILSGAFFAYLERGKIQDYFLAQNFKPTAAILQVQQDLALTPDGARLFRASQPTIGGRKPFKKWCQEVDHSEAGHVLGCYTERRIRLFAVADSRLAGVVEVTAAHELLHAAYQRLSPMERQRLDNQLRNYYLKLSINDPAFKQRMQVYEKLPAASFANELHSVLGTEVAELPPNLEKHYRQWFKDRDKIVALYNSYHSVFTQLQDKAQGLEKQMRQLREQINQQIADYTREVKQFNADAEEFKRRNQNYEFSGQKALFEQLRAELLQRESSLRDARNKIDADSASFNALRAELLELQDTSIELNAVLDSMPKTPAAAEHTVSEQKSDNN